MGKEKKQKDKKASSLDGGLFSSLVGGSKKDKKEKKEKVPKEKKQDNKANDKNADDDTSVSSTGSRGMNWLGQEKKKPRAEFQAEIDELKLKLAGVEADLSAATADRDNANADLSSTVGEL